MPVFVKFEGIEGDVISKDHSSWVNSRAGGLNKVGAGHLILPNSNTNSFGGFSGGVYVAAGDLNANAPTMNGIYVSKISLPNSPFGGAVGFVDSRDVNAVSKAGMFFNAARDSSNRINISIPNSNLPQLFRLQNNLRQMSASGKTIPNMKMIVNDSMNPIGVTYRLENVAVTDVLIAPSNVSLSINFTNIKYEYKPQKGD